MTACEITLKRGDKCTVGRQETPVTRVEVSGGGYSWTLYVTSRDEWWEGCYGCVNASGFKPEYAGIYGGVCFQCGGIGVGRVAGGEKGMLVAIRRRINSRNSRLNAVQRHEQRQRAAAEAYCVAHPNLTSDLARERAHGTLGGNILGELALAIVRAPLSVRQERYATALLLERAWKEAHAIEHPAPVSVHAGSVGESLTLSGVISVWHYLPSERFDRQDNVLIIVDARNAAGEQVLLKMVTAARWARVARKDDSVTVRGTVYEHVDGRYGKQTVLLRPTLVEELTSQGRGRSMKP